MNRITSGLLSWSLLIGSSLLSLVVVGEILKAIYALEHSNRRWQDPNTRFDPDLGWAPVESSIMTGYHGVTTTNNTHGFRSPEVDSTKEQILLAGDSLAWGFGVSDDETIGRQLEKYYDTNVNQVTTVAVPGYGIDQYYLYLKKHLSLFPYIKEVIIVLCTVNDIENTQSNTAYGKQKPLFRSANGSLELTGIPIKKYSRRNMLSFFPLIEKLSSVSPTIGRGLSSFAGDVVLSNSETWEVIINLLEKMKAEFLPPNVPLTIILSPQAADFKGNKTRYEEYKEHLDLQHIQYLDLFPALRNISVDPNTFFIDGVHYNQKGNEIVSKLVFSYISTQ